MPSTILPGYTFDSRSARYRNTATGKFVSRDRGPNSILRLLDRQIDSAEQRLGDIVSAMADKSLSPGVGQTMMRDELRRLSLQNAALARGGIDKLDFRDYGRVGRQLRDNYPRVANLAQGLSNGTVTLDQAMNRIRGYAGDARVLFYQTERETLRATGRAFEQRRRLNPAEHCFPAGTMVQTPQGERPIESLRIGDLVTTRHGARRVTQLFIKDTTDIWSVQAGNKSVTTTGNHPFLTQDGWKRVDELAESDKVMLYENGAYSFHRHIAFPDAFNDIASRGVSGSLRNVAFALSNLTFVEWFKARMPMPPVAINLDYQIADHYINNAARDNNSMRLIGNAKAVKNAKNDSFQLGWIRLLVALFAQGNAFDNIRAFFPHRFALLADAFRRSWLLRWVVLSHVFSGFVVNNGARRAFGQSQVQFVGLVPNGIVRQIEPHGAPARAVVWIVAAQKLILSIRPQMRAKSFAAAFVARLRNKGLGRTALANIAAIFWQQQSVALHAQFGFALPYLAASGASTLEGSFPGFHESSYVADSLPRGNGTLDTIVPQSVTVYNIEVEQAHEYIANGFVVHNCRDCIRYASMGWRPMGELPPPGVDSRCNSFCRCTMETREVTPEMMRERMTTRLERMMA